MLPSPLVAPAVSAFSFDFPRLRVGVAEYSEGPNGLTVFPVPERAYATAAHTSVARAIQTIHREGDGNVLFAAGAADVSAVDPELPDLCVLSSQLACAAVLNCVPKPFTELENVEQGKS
jgi:hypothetical protein